MPSLEALIKAGHDLLLVLTQPDRPGHRNKIVPTPIKQFALKQGHGFADYLDLLNSGSLDAATLKLTAGACVASDAAGQSFHGTGNPCTALDVYVQEWNDAVHTTAIHCWYGGAVVANTCDFSDNTKTISALATASPLTLAGGLTGGAHRYFTIGVQLPSTAGNTYQGRAATDTLTWHIDQ